MENLASPLGLDLLENMMTCSICTDDFTGTGSKIPKMLPCQHSFCIECLKNMCKSSKISCPICRRLFPTTVEELPQNILLIQMLDALPTPVKELEHKIEQLCLDDDVCSDDNSDSSGSEGEDQQRFRGEEWNRKDYKNPDIALEILKAALMQLKQSNYNEDHIDIALDCIRHYRETGNTPVLEHAVECLGYMQLHFLHKIPKFYFKEAPFNPLVIECSRDEFISYTQIADEVLKVFREYGSSSQLKTSCVYVLFTFTSLKYPIFDPIPRSIEAIFEGFDPIQDGGVVEQGIIATIKYLCKKLTKDEIYALSTTAHIQKLIWILRNRWKERYDGTLGDTVSILMDFTDTADAKHDFVRNHGVSYIALLLQADSQENQYVDRGMKILKKIAVVSSKCRKLMISSEGFLDCLKMFSSWTEAEYSHITCYVMTIIANMLLIPKGEWGRSEDKYEDFQEKLKLYSVAERTDKNRGNVPSSLLEDVLPLVEQEESEISRHFGISIMLQLCEGTQGEICKYLIQQYLDVDIVKQLAEEDSNVSSDLRLAANELHELLTTSISTKL